MGPIAPETPDLFNYINNFTDHKTRWKEVYLFRNKGDAVIEALRRFNLDVAFPYRHRIQRLSTDKGGEFTKEE